MVTQHKVDQSAAIGILMESMGTADHSRTSCRNRDLYFGLQNRTVIPNHQIQCSLYLCSNRDSSTPRDSCNRKASMYQSRGSLELRSIELERLELENLELKSSRPRSSLRQSIRRMATAEWHHEFDMVEEPCFIVGAKEYLLQLGKKVHCYRLFFKKGR